MAKYKLLPGQPVHVQGVEFTVEEDRGGSKVTVSQTDDQGNTIRNQVSRDQIQSTDLSRY